MDRAAWLCWANGAVVPRGSPCSKRSYCPYSWHSGGTDSKGCHQNRQTPQDDYHCHNKKDDDGPDWGTIAAVAGGLVLVWIIYEAVSDEGMFGIGPLRVTPYLTERSDTGVVAEYPMGRSGSVGLRAETDDQEESSINAYWRLRF